MALIVEDGSIVPGADTYVSREDYIAYAKSMGVTVEDNEATDVKLRKAANFIDSHEADLKGTKVHRDQPMAFPREGVVLENWPWSNHEIPRQVLLAQLNIALDIEAGIDPFNPPENPSRIVIEERVEGAITVKYSDPRGGSRKLGRDSSATALMNLLLKRSGLRIVLERS